MQLVGNWSYGRMVIETYVFNGCIIMHLDWVLRCLWAVSKCNIDISAYMVEIMVKELSISELLDSNGVKGQIQGSKYKIEMDESKNCREGGTKI